MLQCSMNLARQPRLARYRTWRDGAACVRPRGGCVWSIDGRRMAVVEHEPILSGRKCGRCTLCCKVPPIKELDKPHDQWCQHCDASRGCRIYADRPEVCREFYCGYLTSP